MYNSFLEKHSDEMEDEILSDNMESQDQDEPDGIGHLLRRMGQYKPKKCEEEEGGTNGQLSDYDDPDDQIYQLLKATAPDAEWREGLRYMMKETKQETLRKTLAFLHNNVAAAINLIDDGAGPGRSVDFNSAPDGINCADWMKVMEGLGFEMTSPGTVRDIRYVDVAISENTQEDALKGFCCLMHTMLEVSWANLQTLAQLQEDTGNMLWETVTLLCNGSGIQGSSRSNLVDLKEKYPFLMKSLGFQQDNKGKLFWEKPNGEFDRLSWSIHGLFRRTDVFESPV